MILQSEIFLFCLVITGKKYCIHVNQQTQDFRLLDIYFRKILPVCFSEHMSES